jgi:hypothetical protein
MKYLHDGCLFLRLLMNRIEICAFRGACQMFNDT